MIIAVTKENPETKAYKIAKIVKEKLGKCSEHTVKRFGRNAYNHFRTFDPLYYFF